MSLLSSLNTRNILYIFCILLLHYPKTSAKWIQDTYTYCMCASWYVHAIFSMPSLFFLLAPECWDIYFTPAWFLFLFERWKFQLQAYVLLAKVCFTFLPCFHFHQLHVLSTWSWNETQIMIIDLPKCYMDILYFVTLGYYFILTTNKPTLRQAFVRINTAVSVTMLFLFIPYSLHICKTNRKETDVSYTLNVIQKDSIFPWKCYPRYRF